MSALSELLALPADEQQAQRRDPWQAPTGWAPRAEYDTTEGGFIVSPAWVDGEPEPAEVDLLRERGLDPMRWKVTSIRYSDWQQSKRLENGDRDIITLHAKRVNIAPAYRGTADLDLTKLLLDTRDLQPYVHAAGADLTPATFVHAGGDYQLGKTDGDGMEGTVKRFRAAISFGLARLEVLRERYDITTAYLPHLGDCIEGYVSQGGRNAKRTAGSTGEQLDLLIGLLLEQAQAYAQHVERLVVPVLPGNHDEECRNPDGLEHHSWATFAAKQLQRTLRFAGAAYDHVSVVTPPPGELTLTLDIGGVPTGLLHGHQFPQGKAHDWWDGQAGGMQLIGDARVLMYAHNHHLLLQQPGAKTSLQVPALEGESRWWRHRKGKQGPPGMTTLLMGEHIGRPLTLHDGLTVRSGWGELEVA